MKKVGDKKEPDLPKPAHAGFASRLRLALHYSTLNQAQLGKALRISRVSISRWAAGQRRPDWDVIVRLANALAVDASALAGGGAEWVREAARIKLRSEAASSAAVLAKEKERRSAPRLFAGVPDNKVHVRVRQIMFIRGINPDEAAKALDVGSFVIEQYLRAGAGVRREVAARLIHWLGIDPAWVMRGEGNPPSDYLPPQPVEEEPDLRCYSPFRLCRRCKIRMGAYGWCNACRDADLREQQIGEDC